MVENIIVENGTTWEKEFLFEDLSFLSSKSSCGCTASKSIEVLPNGFKTLVSYKASKKGNFVQWINFKVADKEKQQKEIKLELNIQVI